MTAIYFYRCNKSKRRPLIAINDTEMATTWCSIFCQVSMIFTIKVVIIIFNVLFVWTVETFGYSKRKRFVLQTPSYFCDRENPFLWICVWIIRNPLSLRELQRDDERKRPEKRELIFRFSYTFHLPMFSRSFMSYPSSSTFALIIIKLSNINIRIWATKLRKLRKLSPTIRE